MSINVFRISGSVLVLIALALATAFLSKLAHAESTTLDNSSLMVIGVSVNQHSLADWDVYPHETEFWLPLTLIEKHFGISVDKSNSPDKTTIIPLQSPLGRVSLPINSTAFHPVTGRHISSNDLWRVFKIKTSFDPAEYTIDITVPWPKDSALNRKAHTDPVRVDFPAPSGSLSFIRLENDVNYGFSDTAAQTETSLTVGGSAGSGSWLVRADNENQNEYSLSDFFWNKNYQHTTFRVGTNYANVSPLFKNHQFTGVQGAWTNRDIHSFTDFDLNLGFNSFLTEDITIQQNISRSDGPPAGIAELKLDGNRVALVRIDLTGHYEFKNIQHNQGDYQRVEIHLYEHNLGERAIRIIDLTQNTLDQMLMEQQTLIRAGFGIDGNAFDSTAETEHLTGFLHYRYGITNKLTLQFAAQTNPDHTQSIMAGLRASVGRHWAIGTDIGSQNKKTAMNLIVSGQDGRFSNDFSATSYQAGYEQTFEIRKDRYDVRYAGYWRHSARLKFGFFARHYRSNSNRSKYYTLPGVFGRLNPQWTYYAKPDIDGLYRLGSEYYNGDSQRLTFTHHESGLTTLINSYYQSEWHTYHVGIEKHQTDFDGLRLFAQTEIYPTKHHQNFIQFGANYSKESMGGSLAWNAILRPGIEIQLQYERHNIQDHDDSEQLWLRTRLNFAKSGRRIVPTDNSAINFNRGGISGSIVDGLGKTIDIEEVKLRINGRSLPQSSTDGNYFISDMKPGIYNLAVDEHYLPIEYEADLTNVMVEVRASAITNVDFKLNTKYGFAGQVRSSDGKHLPHTPLTISDSQGNLVAAVSTDNFGFYRVDELPPGKYIVAIKRDFTGENNISVELTDDYLFDRNLMLKGLVE